MHFQVFTIILDKDKGKVVPGLNQVHHEDV